MKFLVIFSVAITIFSIVLTLQISPPGKPRAIRAPLPIRTPRAPVGRLMSPVNELVGSISLGIRSYLRRGQERAANAAVARAVGSFNVTRKPVVRRPVRKPTAPIRPTPAAVTPIIK